MDLHSYPHEMQKLITELMKHNTINNSDVMDEMFINYLYTQRYDEDYIKSMKKDR